jgi:hypothetical protein
MEAYNGVSAVVRPAQDLTQLDLSQPFGDLRNLRSRLAQCLFVFLVLR